jgi:hypothetical protein
MTGRRTSPTPRTNAPTLRAVQDHLHTLPNKMREAFYAFAELRSAQEMTKELTGRHDVGMDFLIVQKTVQAYLEASE